MDRFSITVLEIFSDPARSTRKREPFFLRPEVMWCCPTAMVTILCEREDSAFMRVGALARLVLPNSMVRSTLSLSEQYTCNGGGIHCHKVVLESVAAPL